MNGCQNIRQKIINPLSWIKNSTKHNYALIILNLNLFNHEANENLLCPYFEVYQNFIHSLWYQANITIIADGGIRLLHKIWNNGKRKFIPDYIVGDFDSAPSDLLTLFQNLGSHIIHYPDDYQTDFTKCLRILAKLYPNYLQFFDDSNFTQIVPSLPGQSLIGNINFADNTDGFDIYVLGGLQGRFDHIMGAINTLHIFYNRYASFKSPLLTHKKQQMDSVTQVPTIVLYSSESLAFLIYPKIKYYIYIPAKFYTLSCGIIPFYASPCNGIQTRGLRWNLQSSDTLAWGHMISTSNRYNVTEMSDMPNDSQTIVCTKNLNNGILANNKTQTKVVCCGNVVNENLFQVKKDNATSINRDDGKYVYIYSDAIPVIWTMELPDDLFTCSES